jgi:adenylosuccinate lyase
MSTEAILMRAVRKGGDRQAVHERIRQHSMAAGERVKEHGAANDLVQRITEDVTIGLTPQEIEDALDPARHIGRAPEQVDAFLANEVAPLLQGEGEGEGEELRV